MAGKRPPTGSVSDATRESARPLAWVGRRIERVLRDAELTPKEYGVLALLAEDRSGSSTLADWLAVSRPRLTAIADRLEARGFITRAPMDTDRRRVAHELTSKGAAALAAADVAVGTRVDDLLRHLDDDAREEAERGLVRLNEAVAASRAEFRARALAEGGLSAGSAEGRESQPA